MDFTKAQSEQQVAPTEIDISVSKLLGFENLAIFLRVSESLVSEKSLGDGFGKFGLKKKYWFRFWKIRSREKSLSFNFGEIGLGKKVSVSVLENLVSEKTVLVSVKILVSSFSGPKSTMHYMQHEL